jgi:hypothetical protein
VPTVPALLVLVATDGGGSLLALDSYDGARIASFELPAAEGRLATPPVASGDGSVLIGREKYAASEADLMVLSLRVPEGPAEPSKTTSRAKLGGRFGKETHRGEDRLGESERPRPGRSHRAPPGHAAVAQDR